MTVADTPPYRVQELDQLQKGAEGDEDPGAEEVEDLGTDDVGQVGLKTQELMNTQWLKTQRL